MFSSHHIKVLRYLSDIIGDVNFYWKLIKAILPGFESLSLFHPQKEGMASN